jgi:hypothetical protein
MENFSKEVNIKKHQVAILELGSTTQFKNSPEGLKGRCEQGEAGIKKHEDRPIEITV